jgi:hypothetical protein
MLAGRYTRAQDRAAERVVGPQRRCEQLHHEVVGRVFHHAHLLEDHLLLAGHLLGRKGGVEHDVGQDVDGLRQVGVEHLQVERRVLLGGEGVHVAAHGVHLGRDRLGRAAAGALEHHVLDEVGEPALCLALVAAAALDPHPDRHGAHVGHGLAEQREAVGKNLADDGIGHGSPT